MHTLTYPEIEAPSATVLAESGRVTGRRVSRPVRVCFLIDELATAGTEMQLLALIQHLDRSRVRPFLCLLRGETPASRALEPVRCPVLRLGVGRLRSPATALAAYRFLRFLQRERIDVVQAYFADSSYFGVPLARLAGVPHRLRVRNNLGHWLTPLHRFLGRGLNRLLTGTLVNCEAARKALLAAEGTSPESVRVLENGVDLGRLLALPPVERKPPGATHFVGAVANLRRVKGLDVLVEAAERLAAEHPNLFFRVAGEGEERTALEAAIHRRGLADRFHLLGKVDDIPGFLSGLDVAVLCSRAEGMSNALLEYMAAGRPVVATTVGANAELIEDRVHGWLVPPEDAARLAEGIARLVRDPALARRAGEASRRRARDRYGRAAMVERFHRYYEGLLANEPLAAHSLGGQETHTNPKRQRGRPR